MKKTIEHILFILAKNILKKYKPEIIGITGSVGKTSTKEAFFWILKDKFNVRRNIKNYNTEIGVPLTIINAKSADKNILKWLKVFIKGLGLILIKDKNYPDILILEMAADHPGDIQYLVKMAPCKIGVVTTIGPTHLEFFEDIQNVIKEKQFLISHLKKNGWAILNSDDNLVYPMKEKTTAQVLTYGLGGKAIIMANDVDYNNEKNFVGGIRCKISDSTNEVTAEFKNILSTSQLSSLLAAIAVAKVYNINLQNAVDGLKNFKFPKGRLQLIPGIKNSLIIDDSYNSSLNAVKVALEVLSRIKCSGRRWAVLGDMLELGGYTQIAHQQVGEWIKEFNVDILVTVGKRSIDTAMVAETGSSAALTISGLPKEKVISFDNSTEAGKFIQKEISQGDLILVKGSQGIRMERIVKEIMQEPWRAEELLVRQDKEWLEIN